jgi:DNA-binding GntR family transcriptional regulator
MTIAKELGVSRTPVREALRQLELEGLVKIIPNKGAYVTGITKKDATDIYVMRSVLEGLCARWACKNGTPEDIAALEEINDLAKYHGSKGKYDKVVELDNQFHQKLYEIADSRMLERTLVDFHTYLEPMRKVTLSNTKRMLESIEEHQAIIMALKDGNEELASQLATVHIEKAEENMVQMHLIESPASNTH